VGTEPNPIVTFLLSLLTNVFIVAGFAFKVRFMFLLIGAGSSALERFIRASALTVGLLLLVASARLGMSIADLMLRAVSYTAVSYAVAGVLIPSLTGPLATWYCIRSARRSSNLAARLAILIGTFTIFLFAELYAKAVVTEGFDTVRALVPNLVFTLSIGVYLVFRVDAEDLRPLSPGS
jgi:hypothetical protein